MNDSEVKIFVAVGMNVAVKIENEVSIEEVFQALKETKVWKILGTNECK